MKKKTSGADKRPEIVIDQNIHHTELPRTPISRLLDSIVKTIGDWVSWLWVLLVAVIVLNVTLRYVFGRGYIAFEEAQWHIYAVGWLVGLSYCVQDDTHIRIDILHERFGSKTKAWVDFLGILLFMIPYTAIVLIYSPQFIHYSFTTGEVSDAPGGLPLRWVIKSVMFLAFVLVLLAAIARLHRAWTGIRGVRRYSLDRE